MKILKLSLITVLSVLLCILYSQELISSEPFQEHLKFKDIPINGKINSFAQKLVNIGYQRQMAGEENELIILKGEFVNKQCAIVVNGTKKTKTAYLVTVLLPTETDWSGIKDDYFKLKKLFQQKYGMGMSKEVFSEPYYEDSGLEMQALKLGKCTYYTIIFTKKSSIMITIMPEGRIVIGYEDSTNAKLKEIEEEIINSDI